MRLTVIFLTIAFLQVSASGNSQTVNFSGKNVSLKEIFTVIEKQTGHVFFYDVALLREAKPVTIQLKNVSLEEALAAIFKSQPLTWVMENRTITILKKAEQINDAWTKVLNKEARYRYVIDAATLTGAALRAIGTEATIIMGNAEDTYFQDLEKIGFDVHERVVRFPFWDDYKAHMKSKIADMKNIGGPNAGMISAGKFLEHFVKAPYIHMDIAGPAWLDSKENYKGDGGTGAGVRLLYQFLKNRYK